MNKILVTGACGQLGGGYLIPRLLSNPENKVIGLKRRSSSLNTERLDHIYQEPQYRTNFDLVYGDLADTGSLVSLIEREQFDQIYNLGAMSFVKASFDIPEYTMDVTGTAVVRLLDAIKRYSSHSSFVQMSSSEMLGGNSEYKLQDESTPFDPKSPYGCAKALGYYAVRNYRQMGIKASNIISFNYESPYRGEVFVTRKITRAACRIKLKLQKELFLGNLHAFRDWSHASDIADGVILAMNETDKKPGDWCLASGTTRSVQEFLEIVFTKLDLNWKDYYRYDSRYERPSEVEYLCGSAAKAKRELGWEPKYTFEQLVDEMIAHDMKQAQLELKLKELNEQF